MLLGEMCRLCSGQCPQLMPLSIAQTLVLFPNLLKAEESYQNINLKCCLPCNKNLQKFYEWHLRVDRANSWFLNKLDGNKRQHIECSYECVHCQKVFDSKSSIKCHIRVEHLKKLIPFECHMCCKSFSTQVMRNNHETYSHRKDRLFLCHVCGMQFKHLHNLGIHVKIHDENRPKLTCHLCPKTFLNRRDAKDHANIHSGSKPYACTCGMTFTGAAHLRQHKRVHQRQLVSCALCLRTFTRKSNLAAHITLVHSKGAENDNLTVQNPASSCKSAKESVKKTAGTLRKSDVTKCNICDKVFAHHGSLSHARQKLTKAMQTTSRKDCMAFPLGALDYREAIEDSPTQDSCPMSPHLMCITYHRRVVHTRHLPFVCSVCDTRFAAKGALNSHHRRAHQNNSQEDISQEWVATLKEEGVDHEGKIGTSETSQVQPQESDARRMNETVSSHDGKFMCEICAKRFKWKTSLRMHVLSHTDTRPHKCPTCASSFLRKFSLLRHAKRCRPKDRYYCPKCGKSFSSKQKAHKHAPCCLFFWQ